MKSHFNISSRNIEFTPPPVRKMKRGIQFGIGSRAALACAVTGATAMMTTIGSAQIAYDSASGSTYSGGWSAGQNGGSGFGAWSFNGTTDPSGTADPGAQQTMSSLSSIGTAWTMFNLGSAPGGSGISDTGRAITEPGGLQVGQTFLTVIQNPTAYNFYGGFDVLFNNATDNNAAGNNASVIRASVFNYFGNNWGINDPTDHATTLSSSTTGAAGMDLSLTLDSATAYTLTLTPLSNPSGAYTYNGTYSGAINYVNFRLYDGLSAGPNDTANNLEISSIEITSVPEPSSWALISGLGASGLLFLRRRK